jgi:hypothetical protein
MPLSDRETKRLYEEARKLARRDDPVTSRRAAEESVDTAATNRMLCLRAHATPEALAMGRTFDEVAIYTGLDEHETGRRCADLRNKELIRWAFDENNDLVTRKTRLGRGAGVCFITEEGVACLI